MAKYLDPKRAQEVGIMIKSKHLDIAEIENAVYNLDTSHVDFETLGQIKQIMATKEEILTFQGHVEASPDIPLDAPEQFLLHLSEITYFNERMECLTFQSLFSEHVNDITIKIDNLNHVCDQLLNSSSLKNVFSIILTCGNYMNGGNKQRGQADGFDIAILPKLKDVKSGDNSITLLQYIVRCCIENYDDKKGTSDSMLPVLEPSDVEKCGNVNFDEQMKECKVLWNKIITIIDHKREIEEGDPEHSELFGAKMKVFLDKAVEQVYELCYQIEAVMDKFVKTMKFYQFVPKDNSKLEEVQPKDFFCIWYPFCEDYKNIWKREQLKIEKEMIIQRRVIEKIKKEKREDIPIEPTKPHGLKERMKEKFRKISKAQL